MGLDTWFLPPVPEHLAWEANDVNMLWLEIITIRLAQLKALYSDTGLTHS